MENSRLSNIPTAVYGIGGTANSLFATLNQRYNIVCFCVSDSKKQGTCFQNLPVYSYESAIEKWSDLQIYVATTEHYKYAIMDDLIQKGLPRERIINYEPYKKYVSCSELESRIGVSGNYILFCPSSFGRNESPRFEYTGDPVKDIENFKKSRDYLIECLQKKQTEGGISTSCQNCSKLSETFWAVDRRIKDVCFSIKHKCNFRCCYCIESKYDKTNITGEEHLDEVLDLLSLMRKNNVLDRDAVIRVAPTEISIHPYRNKILDALSPYVCQFTTNAFVYVEAIADALKKGGKVLSSIDAGTPQTFRKIKGAGRFQTVCENLKKYSTAGNVEVKYIFLEGINDNIPDVEGFLDACEFIQPKGGIHISRDTTRFAAGLGEETLSMIVHMINLAVKRNIAVNCSPEVFSEKEYSYIQSHLKKERA